MTLGGSFPVRSETTRRRTRPIVVPNGDDAVAARWADGGRVIFAAAAAGRRLRPMRRAPPSLCMVWYVLLLCDPTRKEREGTKQIPNSDKYLSLALFSTATAQRIVRGCWYRSFDVRLFFAICSLLFTKSNRKKYSVVLAIPQRLRLLMLTYAIGRSGQRRTAHVVSCFFFVLSSAAGVIDVSIDRALVMTGKQPAAGAESEKWVWGSFIAHAGVHLCLADSQKIAQDVPADSKTGDGQSHVSAVEIENLKSVQTRALGTAARPLLPAPPSQEVPTPIKSWRALPWESPRRCSCPPLWGSSTPFPSRQHH